MSCYEARLRSDYAWCGKTTVRRKDGIESKETEIDLLAVSAKSDKYLVGECKFKGRPFSYGEYLDTAAKLAAIKEKAEFYYYLFSESGLTKKSFPRPLIMI